MAFTLNRRLAQLVDSNGQLNTGKIPNDYITSDHVADNTITSAMLHTSFTVSTSNLTAIDTDDVSEGSSNLYYTNARADARIAAATTDDLTEGSTNLYYTTARWDTKMAAADTDDLSEGSTNLYFTNARVDSRLSGGTGVTYSSGEISIGQDVGTSATPTFGNITTTGYIAGPATFTIDPAAVGDNTGTVVIAGNLQVDGTTTTINSTTMEVDDLNITLASGAANAAAANGAGLTVDCGSDTDATFTYDGTNDEWDFNKDINVSGSITTGQSMSINNSQVGVIQQAHGITSGNTVANKFQVGRWKGVTFDKWMLVPVDDGTAQYSNEFGYNFSTSAWFFDSLVNFAGNITLGDNDKAIFGADSDLQIYHDGSGNRSYITESGTGDFFIQGNNLIIENTGGENYFRAVNGGAVQLYYSGSEKLATTSTGIDVTGTVTSDGLTVDGTTPLLYLTESDTTDLNSRIRNSAGNLQIHTANDAQNSFTARVNISHSTGDISIYDDTGTTAKLFWDASAESLGIGTDEPNQLLHLDNSTNTTDDAIIRILSGNAGLSGIYLGDPDYGSISRIRHDHSDNTLQFWSSNVAGTSSLQRMTIAPGGNIGIGITDPVARLDVTGTTTDYPTVYDYLYATGEGIRVYGEESALDLVGQDTGGHASSILLRNENEGFGIVNNPGSNILQFRSFDVTADDFYIHSSGGNVANLVDILTLEKTGNVGIGCTPDAWSGYSVLQIGTGGALSANEDVTFLSANGYSSSTGWRYATTDEATLYQQQGGEHIWLRAVSGSADGLITWVERMRLQDDRLKLNNGGLEIVNSAAAEITFSGTASGGNLVSEADLYLLAGSGTANGALYLGSAGTNAQVQLIGGQLGLGTSPNAKLHVAGTIKGTDLIAHDSGGLAFQTDEGTKRISILDSGNVVIGDNSLIGSKPTGSALNIFGDGVTLRFDGGSNSTKTILFRGTSAGNPGEVYADGGLRFRTEDANMPIYFHTNSTGSNNERMRIDGTGNVGINTTSPHGKLDVKGGITLINGNVDFGTHNHSSYASVLDSGEINFTVGYSGTLTASRNFVFTYEATSWKAWGCEIEMASTEGLATWKVGGYNNNSGGHNSYEENDQNAMASLSYSRSGQQNIITLGFDRTHIHPCFRVRYFQSGGDGAPRMNRVKVEIT